MIIKGTKAAVMRPIAWMPPRRTEPTKTKRMAPVAAGAMPKVDSILVATALACARLPMPKEAQIAKIAKKTASAVPRGPGIPRLRYCCGPPDISPLESVVRKRTPRYASVYLEAMPTRPVIQIHTSAPGPPIESAVATPTIFPTPTVAARAVVSA